MKARNTIFILVILLMATEIGFAQSHGRDPGKVTRLQNTRRWEKEIPAYKKVLENGEFPAVMEKLADCYRMSGDLENAEIWYRNALVNGNQNSECRLNYAKVLQGNGKYQEAKDQFVLYEEITGEYEIGEKYIASCEMAMRVKDNKLRYEIRPMSQLNSQYSDIVAINSDDEIYFATRGSRRDIGSHRDSRSSTSDYDLYRAKKRTDGTVSDIKSVKGKINSRYDDIGAVKMPGSDVVLFTRAGDMPSGQKKTVGTNGPGQKTEIKILGAKLKGRKAETIEPLPLDFGDGTHNFHPAVHPSGDLIIFASDRAGGFGGVDLYMVRRSRKGQWSMPVNMGPEINTEGDELFPSFNGQGYLYFASDGHIGYGGLDLYTVDKDADEWKNVTNMGAGINSPKDDFGIVWDQGVSTGYFTSNRNAGTGDDIYYFKRTPSITGQVFDGMNREQLAGSIVRLKDISGNEKIIITDGAGQFSEACKPNTGYLVTVDAPGFHTWRDTFWTRTIPQGRDVNLDIFLEVEQRFELNGFVFDEVEGARLGASDIEVVEAKKTRKLTASPDSADYSLRLKPGNDYTIIFKKDKYIPRILNLSLTNFRGVEVRERNVPMKKGDYVLISGKVVEEGSENTLHRAALSIVDNNTQKVIDSTLSLRNGTFWVAVPWDSAVSNYSIIASRDGYFSASRHIEEREKKEMEIALAMTEATVGLDHNMKVIHYGYNEARLGLLSKKELNEIYFFLNENPDAKLEIRSHTDSRGSSRYNLELSRKRSEEVIKYIRKRRPIPEERFISWGFGEEFLLNDCYDGANCTEEEHAANRRTEIKVVE